MGIVQLRPGRGERAEALPGRYKQVHIRWDPQYVGNWVRRYIENRLCLLKIPSLLPPLRSSTSFPFFLYLYYSYYTESPTIFMTISDSSGLSPRSKFRIPCRRKQYYTRIWRIWPGKRHKFKMETHFHQILHFLISLGMVRGTGEDWRLPGKFVIPTYSRRRTTAVVFGVKIIYINHIPYHSPSHSPRPGYSSLDFIPSQLGVVAQLQESGEVEPRESKEGGKESLKWELLASLDKVTSYVSSFQTYAASVSHSFQDVLTSTSNLILEERRDWSGLCLDLI